MKKIYFILFLLLIEVFTSLLSAAVINHNIGTGDLVILGTSTDDYIVTGSTNKHCIFVNFGYKGSITLQNCSIRYESTWGSVISPIRITGQNNMSNTDQRRTNVNIILDGHNSIYNVGTLRDHRACIQVDQGAQINISAIDPCDNSSGTLVVTQENAYGGAGIGSRIHENNYYETSSTAILNNGEEAITAGGNIVISSGTITAKGGHGAGIGGGHQSYFDGMIVIYGGIINVSSLRHAAGMGSGCPTGYGVLEEYTPNSAIVVVPPAEISAVGAGGDDGETLDPELGLAGTKVRVYIGDPGKPAINVSTIDNMPNANIYVDLSQHPDVLQTITTAIDSSKLNVNKILLGRTDANGVFSTTGSLINSTTFFTDATNTSSGSFGRPYMPITQALADGGNITLPLLPTKINIFSKSSDALESSYTQAQAKISATAIKIVYNDPYPMSNITFDLAAGTSTPFSNLIFLSSDSSTIVSAPTSLRQGDKYYIIAPIKTGLPTKVYSDVLRISGTWKGSPTGYIRQVVSQIVADIQTIHICEGSSYYFNGEYLTEEGIYTDATNAVYVACAIETNTSNTIRLVVEKTKHTSQTAYLCDNTYEWHGETLTAPGTYTKTLKTQWNCDSIVTLYLKAAQKYNHSFNATICQGSTYKWAGSTYSTSGNYTKHFQSVAGCDSTVTLHLTVAPKYNHSFNATICQGETYTWEGSTYSTSGNYTKHFQSVAGCDSTVTLHLTVAQNITHSFYDTICQGSTYKWEGTTYSATGDYTKHLQSKAGCDSIVTLHLFVAQKYTHSFRDTICQGETYTWEGSTYRVAGNYKKYLKSISGCDSTVTLNLYVAPKYTHYFRDTICQGETYTWEGTTYNASGNYTKHLQSKAGCDSTVTLRLHVAPKYAHAFYAKFCEGSSYTWKGAEYSAAGDYTKQFQSVVGCDSTVTMHLTKMASTDSIEEVTICAGSTHTWHGQTFSSSITTTETITNAAGCDSVCTLKLTVLPALIGDTSATFCNGNPFRWHGVDYSTAGDYPYTYTSKVTGCDSIVTLHLTQLEPTDSIEVITICAGASHIWHGQTFSSSITTTETITNAAGCDSVCTLKLTVLPALTGDTSATFCNGNTFKWHGVDYSTAGDYQHTYTSKVTGCDSIVTLHLTQLEPSDSVEIATICAGESHTWHGHTFSSSITKTETIDNAVGCDSICTLQLTVLSALTGDTTATFCNGHPFKWHGTDYSTAGDYQHTYTSKVTGCDSIVTLHLAQLEPTDSIEVVTICAGASHTWHGKTFTTSTTITETILNSVGCDSVCTLQLIVLPTLTDDTSATFCNGHPFKWHGVDYSIGGDYPYTYTSKVTGCDSIVTLHLTQLEPTDSIEEVTICAGSTHTWHGQTFSSSITTTETITNAAGCDSVCTLKLTVLPALTGDTSATFCKGHPFKWHGIDYLSAGDYSYTYTSKVAPYCDSIVTLHLSQLEPTDSVENVIICEGETHYWHGNPYTSTTNVTETITNAVGCDSICTLHLKVNPKLSSDTTASVCDGGAFTWWGNTYSTKGDYTRTFQSQVTGCDSIVTLHLNILPPLATTLNESITEGATYLWNGQTYTKRGTYTQSYITDEGCDSIVTLNLIVNPLIYDILAHIQCADDPYIEFDVTASDGLFQQLQFVFTPKAIAQHFRDTIVDYSASQILIPNSARAGIYEVAVSPLYNSQVLDTRNIQFTLLYPSSVLDQHWDDFIGVLTHNYNGGYDFVSFQWYKNGQPMVGENHSYTYQPLEMGAAYSAMLEEQDGTKLMTCEIIATPQTEISIYPTLLQPRQMMRLHNTNDVTIWLYDNLGKMIYTSYFAPGDHQLNAPQTSGVYIIRIQQTGISDKIETKKLIVR